MHEHMGRLIKRGTHHLVTTAADMTVIIDLSSRRGSDERPLSELTPSVRKMALTCQRYFPVSVAFVLRSTRITPQSNGTPRHCCRCPRPPALRRRAATAAPIRSHHLTLIGTGQVAQMAPIDTRNRLSAAVSGLLDISPRTA